MHKFEDNFDIKSKNGYNVYTLKKDFDMDLKFKTIENQGKVSVYINIRNEIPCLQCFWEIFRQSVICLP